MTSLGCTFDPRQNSLFLWERIPPEVESSEALADNLLYEKGIFLTPGFIFGTNGDRYIRISLCADEQTLLRALNRITN